MLKAAAPVIARALTKIFNQLLKAGAFPSDFNIGEITALHKSGNRSHCIGGQPQLRSLLAFHKVQFWVL